MNTLNSYVNHPANERKREFIRQQLAQHDAAIAAVQAALAQQEAQKEPVAWLVKWPDGWNETFRHESTARQRAKEVAGLAIPLYTRPAPIAEAKVMASPVPEDVQRDANRYRCLRQLNAIDWMEFPPGVKRAWGTESWDSDVDAAVDALLAAAPQPGETNV